MRAALAGLTLRGRCLLATGVALAGSALVLGQRDLLRAAVLVLALPLTAAWVVARTRYRLACERTLEPSRVEAGREAAVRLRLDNVSRLPTGVLLMEDRLPYTLGARPRFVLDRVEPRAVREMSYPVRSEVRGRFTVGPLSVRLTDPFGLCELTRSFTTSEDLVVTPVVTPLPPVRVGGAGAAGGEGAARPVASGGTDDASTREYRHGDDLRKVHWRSSARVGELMVRREEQAFQSRATLLLDTRAAAHRGDGSGSSFECAVSAAASVGVALARSGFSLSLLLPSAPSPAPLGARVTPELLLDVLATVGTTAEATLDAAVDGVRTTSGGGVLVAVLGALPAGQAERLARLRRGPTACVAVLVDTDSWAAGRPVDRSRARQRHEQSAALLAAAGWRVVPVDHGTTLASVWPLAAGRPALAHVPGGAG
jgi:uncharacterized protein (DUF58 family)